MIVLDRRHYLLPIKSLRFRLQTACVRSDAALVLVVVSLFELSRSSLFAFE